MYVFKNARLVMVGILLVLASGCGSQNQAKQDNETVALDTKADTLCFQQVTGRDSVRLQLFTKGTRVTGNLVLRPYEKDQAQGSIVGVRTGNEITADWQRSGEGVMQTYVVNFELIADTLRWREGERLEKDGKWLLKTPDQGFQYKLIKVDCQ